MSQQITKREDLSPVAAELLKDLRELYKKPKKRKRPKIVMGKDEKGKDVPLKDPEKGGFLYEIVEYEEAHPLQAQIEGLLKKYPVTVMYDFVQRVKPHEREHIMQLIEKEKFDIENAIQAYCNSLTVASDRSIQPRNWQEAEACNSPTLATLRKYKSEPVCVSLVHMMLVSLSEKFGVRSSFVDIQGAGEEDDEQGSKRLKELAADIVSQYRTLTIADIKLILRRLLNRGGKIYSLDEAVIFEAIEAGLQERDGQHLKQREQQHKVLTYNEKHRPKKRLPKREPMSLEEQLQEMQKREQADKELKGSMKRQAATDAAILKAFKGEQGQAE